MECKFLTMIVAPLVMLIAPEAQERGQFHPHRPHSERHGPAAIRGSGKRNRLYLPLCRISTSPYELSPFLLEELSTSPDLTGPLRSVRIQVRSSFGRELLGRFAIWRRFL